MNADQLKGKWTQFKGELKQKWGEFTDNDLQEIGGNYEKFIGKVQERYGDKKTELMKWADSPTAGRPGLGGLVEGGMPTGRRSREEITRTVDRVEVHVDHKRRYGHEHELYVGTLSAERSGILSRIGMNWKAGWRRCLPLARR